MRTKICPICDQKIRGNYCKICRQFVTPVVYESDFMLNESRDGNDYFELQLNREKEIRQRGATDLNDGHKNHPQVNQPKDRRIENINGRQMNTTQMPSTYSQRSGSYRDANGRYAGSTRTSGQGTQGSRPQQNKGCAAGSFGFVFIVILIVQIIMAVMANLR